MRKAKRRHYTDADRAAGLAALDANGGDVSKTARQLGVPRKTLQNWARGRTAAPPANLGQEKKRELALLLETVAYQLADVSPEQIAATPLPGRFTSMGIAIDKMRLLRGQSTANTDSTHHVDLSRLSDAQLDQLDQLDAAARPRAAAP